MEFKPCPAEPGAAYKVALPPCGQLQQAHDFSYMFQKRPTTQQRDRSASAAAPFTGSHTGLGSSARRQRSPSQPPMHQSQHLQQPYSPTHLGNHPSGAQAWGTSSGSSGGTSSGGILQSDARASWPLQASSPVPMHDRGASPSPAPAQAHRASFTAPSQQAPAPVGINPGSGQQGQAWAAGGASAGAQQPERPQSSLLLMAPIQPQEFIQQQQQPQQQQQQRQQVLRPATSPATGRFVRDSVAAAAAAAAAAATGEALLELDGGNRGPDPRAMKWLRDQYPMGIPTATGAQRTDALSVLWQLEGQLGELHQAWSGGTGGVPQGASRPGSPGPGLPVGGQAGRKSSSGGTGGGGGARGSGLNNPCTSGAAAAQEAAAGGLASPKGGRASVAASAAPGAPLPDVFGSLKDSVLLVRDGSGFLNAELLGQQEAMFSKCMSELCRQVAISCLERGFLIHQLWQALRYFLRAALADRDLAWSVARDARMREHALADAVAAATAQLRSEKDEATRINEALNKRLVMRQAEAEKQKHKVSELQAQLGGLAGIQPEVLRQQVADQNMAIAHAQNQVVALTVRLDRATQEIAAKDKEVQLLAARLTELQAEAEAAAAELSLRTPRPAQPARPPWDLLTQDQSSVAMRALREGCSPEDLHRLLIGVSAGGFNVMPFMDLLGCCRHITPHHPTALDSEAHDRDGDAAKAAEAASGHGGLSPLRGGRSSASTGGMGGAGEGGGGQGRGLSSRSSVSRRNDRSASPDVSLKAAGRNSRTSDAASVIGRPDAPSMRRETSGAARKGDASGGGAAGLGGTAASGLGGNGGGGADGGPLTARQQHARRVVASLQAHDTPVPELHAFLRELLARHKVPALLPYLKDAVVQAVSQMLNHGADVDSVACLLIGVMSPTGVMVTPYKSLAGALATRFKQDAADVGGPITEALSLARGSTFDRVLCLEKSLLLQRRRALKCGWMMDEQQRQEARQQAGQEARAARKVQLPRHPVELILAERHLEFFTGLGLGEDIPAVLRHEGKVFHSDMDRREVLRIVRGMWAAKSEQEAAGAERQLLPDFCAEWMLKRYGTPHMVAQTVYNLLSTAASHLYDPELLLFLKAFMGEVEDSLHDTQQRQIQQLLDTLSKRDAALNKQVTGWLLKAEIRACLEKVLPHKGEEQIQALMGALESDEPEAMVQHEQLFQDNVDGHCSVFADVLRHQTIQEALYFHRAIQDALLDAVEQAGAEAAVTPAMVIAAIYVAHPGMPPNRVEQLLGRVYGPDVAHALRQSIVDAAAGGKVKGAKSKAALDVQSVLRLLRTPAQNRPKEAPKKKEDVKPKSKR